MEPERWQKVEELYHEALARRGAERSTYLEQACGADQALRRDVERLLAAEQRAGSFLQEPAIELVAQDLAVEERRNLIGTQLGRYTILSLLGAGGMGEVYRARDERLDRDVAVKVLPEDLTENREALARFEREARAVAALSHPNILAIHDFGAEGKMAYAVTELLDGETLRGRLERGPLPWREAVKVILEVTDGLSAAHAKGIIHRDLKPANLFVTESGRVKVLDFGLARVSQPGRAGVVSAEPTSLQTESGVVVGTVGYMAPEQVRGEAIDERGDLFSLGCVLYEMVSGMRAFARDTAAEVLAAILRDEPPELADTGAEVPAELERVIKRCLKKEAGERYQSVDDLVTELRALLNDPGPARALASWPGGRRRPARWAAALAVLLLVAGVALWWGWRGRPAGGRAIDSIAVLPLVNASGDEEIEYLSDGLTEDLINSLSHLSNLRVIARTTVFQYKGRDVDPLEVGDELQVGAVLTGRVALRGDTLSIQADLLDVASGAQLWGDKFNKKLTDIFAVQEEMARRITNGLRLKLPGAEEQRLTRHYTENVEAYQLYLKGRREAYKFNREGLESAPGYFRQAIQLDPSYALAWAGLAEYHMIYYDMIYYESRQSGAQAKDAAMKALALDDTLAEAHTALANVSEVYEWDWSQAAREYQRAIALSPGSASAHSLYGFYLAKLGRLEEAGVELQLAQRLDPLSPAIYTNLGRAYYLGRRFDQAIEQFLEALKLEPNFYLARLYLGRAYEQQGQYDAAVAELQKAVRPPRLRFGSGGRPWLARGLAVAGRQGEARQLLAQLQPSEQYALAMAALYTGLNDKDQAFTWLEKAFEERYGTLSSIKVDPAFDPLRSDPRFDDLLRRMGLAP